MNGGENGRGVEPAEGQTAIVQRLVEQIPERRAQRPGQDEGGPEQ